MANLSMTRGDSKTLLITIGGLGPTGLTGYTGTLTAKRSVADLDNAAVVQKAASVKVTGSDTVDGIFQVDVAPADTSALADTPVRLYYDFQIKDSLGTTTTVASGYLTVSPDITRTA